MTRGSLALSATLACLTVHACTPDFGTLNAGGEGGAAAEAGASGLGGSSGGMAGAGTGGSGRGASGGAGGTLGGSAGMSAGSAGAPQGGGDTGGSAGEIPISAGAGSGGAPQGGFAGDAAGQAGSDAMGGEGGAREWPQCPGAGSAVFFGPAVYVTAPRPIQDSFTIEAWIKLSTSLPGPQFWQGSPVLWGDVSGDAPDFGLSVVNGKLVMNIGAPDTATTSLSVVATGRWVHIGVTRSGITGLVELYVNGVREITATGTRRPLDAAATISIGTVQRRDLHFNGSMDELRLWATVRTQAELRAGMFVPPREEEPGLVGYYRFDETWATRLTDSSHKRNHATIAGTIKRETSTAPFCSEGGDGGAGGEGGAGGYAGAASEGGAGGYAGAASEAGSDGTFG